MALDYDDRIDFRAFDVLASAIENATAADLERAILSCNEIARNWTHGTISHVRIKRLLFKGFANLMRLYLRKFNGPRKPKGLLWQQTVTKITRGL